MLTSTVTCDLCVCCMCMSGSWHTVSGLLLMYKEAHISNAPPETSYYYPATATSVVVMLGGRANGLLPLFSFSAAPVLSWYVPGPCGCLKSLTRSLV